MKKGFPPQGLPQTLRQTFLLEEKFAERIWSQSSESNSLPQTFLFSLSVQLCPFSSAMEVVITGGFGELGWPIG